MAATILSQDMVAIGLLLSEGNVDITLGELFSHAREYEKRNQRYFGVFTDDYACSLRTFVYFTLFLPLEVEENPNIKFKGIIPDMLKYHSAYFKDTEDYWIKNSEVGEIDIFYNFNYTDDEYEKKIKLKNEMQKFFHSSRINSISIELVKEFMEANNINEEILEHCSRKGWVE